MGWNCLVRMEIYRDCFFKEMFSKSLGIKPLAALSHMEGLRAHFLGSYLGENHLLDGLNSRVMDP